MTKPLKERRLKYYDDHIIIKNYMKAPIAYCISQDRLVLINPDFKEIDLFDIEDEELRRIVEDYIFNRLDKEFPLLDKVLLRNFREDCSLKHRLQLAKEEKHRAKDDN